MIVGGIIIATLNVAVVTIDIISIVDVVSRIVMSIVLVLTVLLVVAIIALLVVIYHGIFASVLIRMYVSSRILGDTDACQSEAALRQKAWIL